MILMDNPGAREDPAGQPFVCGTRLTLLAAAECAGLSRKAFYLTYILKCRPRRAYNRPAAWSACLNWLVRQIELYRPQVLTALGNNVLRALTGDALLEVKNCRGKILAWHGRPLVAGYHPLAVRRRPSLFPLLVADLRTAKNLAETEAGAKNQL